MAATSRSHEPIAVLGIDAAWTDRQPSGVALLKRQHGKWRCVRVAPSYHAFCTAFHWSEACSGSPIAVQSLIAACASRLNGAKLVAVAVDMPLARTAVTARRRADDLVSQRYAHRACAVHSPTDERPGATGRRLHEGFTRAGFELATQERAALPALLETYPHLALLGLTGRERRLPYKAAKTRTYWKRASIAARKRLLVKEWRSILQHLSRHIQDIALPLPDTLECSFQFLKRYEDALDALVCAWVATLFIEGAALALGDEHAAVWIPQSASAFARVA